MVCTQWSCTKCIKLPSYARHESSSLPTLQSFVVVEARLAKKKACEKNDPPSSRLYSRIEQARKWQKTPWTLFWISKEIFDTLLRVVLVRKSIGRTIAQSTQALALKIYDFSSCMPLSQILLPPFHVILTMQILEQVLTCISYFLSYHSMWLRACTSEEATVFYQQHKYPSSWSWRGQRLVCDNH